MSAQPQPLELTYGEIREWASILGCFTSWDLARAMGVEHGIGIAAVNALCMQGICRNTGDMLDGPYGYEYIIEYIPPPTTGPSSRERGPDPAQIAISQAGRITVERGTPVRIRTNRKVGRALSTPGQRQKHKNRERNYQRQQDARTARADKQKSKAQNEPNWKKQK